MAAEHFHDTIAPLATKTGANFFFLAGAISWINQNVGFFSAIAMITGAIVGVCGIFLQVRNDKRKEEEREQARLMNEAHELREAELHALRVKSLKKQLDQGKT